MQALTVLLAGTCRLSRRQVQSLLEDLCGIRLSLGMLVTLEADIAQASVLGVDGTGSLLGVAGGGDPPLAVNRGHPGL